MCPALSSTLSKDQDGIVSSGMKSWRALALLGSGAAGLLGFATVASADEAEHGLAAADYPWPHSGILSSYDHASLVPLSLCFIVVGLPFSILTSFIPVLWTDVLLKSF